MMKTEGEEMKGLRSSSAKLKATFTFHFSIRWRGEKKLTETRDIEKRGRIIQSDKFKLKTEGEMCTH